MPLFLYDVKNHVASTPSRHLSTILATCLGSDLLCTVMTRLLLGPPLSCGGTNCGAVHKKIVKAAVPEMREELGMCICSFPT